MDAEAARQERIMGISHIVRQKKAALAAKREMAASRQRGRYHHLQSYAQCNLFHNKMRSGAQV